MTPAVRSQTRCVYNTIKKITIPEKGRLQTQQQRKYLKSGNRERGHEEKEKNYQQILARTWVL